MLIAETTLKTQLNARLFSAGTDIFINLRYNTLHSSPDDNEIILKLKDLLDIAIWANRKKNAIAITEKN